MDEDVKRIIIQDLNLKIGGDINDLRNAYELENNLIDRRNNLQSSLNLVNDAVPSKLTLALKKAEHNSNQTEEFKKKIENHEEKVKQFLDKTKTFKMEIDKRFNAVLRLEKVLSYLKSLEEMEVINRQMTTCSDDDLLMWRYGQLKEMCGTYKVGHRGECVREYTHYWHNVLKDRLSRHYEEVLKLLKWPVTPGAPNSPPPKEILGKFVNLTRYLFLVEEPVDGTTVENVADSGSEDIGQDPCLPVRLLLKPLKKRFIYHFTGPRPTARIDRPEWFLTQIITWIKDHEAFVKNNVQPVADKLKLKNVKAVDEFNAGLIALAAERLHTVLGLYSNHGSSEVDMDAAFAHAVDETLGFHRELVLLTGTETNSVLSVLTKAEMFVRWLAVEKKYALTKMDETLGSEMWSEAVASGLGSAVGSVVWVPRGADLFIALLKTIEDRYAILPQPGHRLQFLELQLELIEEWRIRLTQLLNAAVGTLTPETFLVADSSPHPLTSVINAAHHTRTVLLQWAHSLHYLQLHYYRRQFQQFTEQQHHDETEDATAGSSEPDNETEEDSSNREGDTEERTDDNISLKDVEMRAKNMALDDIYKQAETSTHDLMNYDLTSPIANLAITDQLAGDADAEEAGVFAEAPALLAHLRDAGLAALAEHILLEFKAGLRDYKKQKWHAWLLVEEMALTVSTPLCRPLSGICARLQCAGKKLAPPLTARLRAHLANEVDQYIFEEVVLESWFNTGGMLQFTHDVKRNLVPAFAPPNKVASQVNQLPKLLDACKLLNMDYEDARRLRSALIKTGTDNPTFSKHQIRHIQPTEALQILNQRTDLSEEAAPASVMELF